MTVSNLRDLVKDESLVKVLEKSANITNECEGACTQLLDTIITGVTLDSRKVQSGYVFVAIKGFKTDGHEYIDTAIKNGAVAVVCEDLEVYKKVKDTYNNVCFLAVKSARKALAIISKAVYENVSDKLCIVGITGTKGKTSTSFMISEILRKAGLRVGIIGTTGAYFESFYEELSHSTPESCDLHRLFFEMYKRGCTHIVMEVSSQAILMSRVDKIRFNTAVFTNITPDHIGEGEHSDFEDYLSCKAKLFEMCDNAVVNLDSDRAGYILDICASEKVNTKTFGFDNEKADFCAKNEKFYIDGGMKTKFTFVDNQKNEESEILVGVPGKFSIFNALCAITCAGVLGVDIEVSKNALENVKVIGRIEPCYNQYCKAPVIIDYAHNAVSLMSVISAINEYNPKRIICVFGCGGNRSKLRRYEMGEVSGKLAHLSVITADNSRFEELSDIIDDILVGMKKTNGEYVIVEDRYEAIHYAMREAKEGDVVLLAGKGQETYLDVKGVKTHFDEREVVAAFKG